MYISLGGNCSVAYFLKENKLNRIASPFDWSDSTITQLNLVLENDFENFLKIKKIFKSSSHESDVLTNYDGIKLAHFLNKEKLLLRIKNFYQLKKKDEIQITFIRIEHKKIKNNYLLQLERLIKNLQKFSNNFIVKVILPLENQDLNNLLNKKELFNKIELYFYPTFDSDWKIPSFQWNKLR